MVDQLEVLYRSRLPEFRRVAAAIVGDRELGCDAVQEAFANAVRNARSFRGRGTLEAWVWRIVVKDRKSTRLNSSHSQISYAVFCLKKKASTASLHSSR